MGTRCLCVAALLVTGCGSTGDEYHALAGTWLITYTNSTGVDGRLSLADGFGSISSGMNDATVAMVGDIGTGTWARLSTSRWVTVRRDGPGIQLGELPFQVGGTWTMQDHGGSDRCTAVMSATELSNTCNIDGGEVPGVGHLAATIQAQRTLSRPSIVGDLGGDWTLTAGAETCTATISEATFTATCHDSEESRTITVVVNGDVASATSDYGLEFAATRYQ